MAAAVARAVPLPPKGDYFIDITEVCRRLSVSRVTLQRMILRREFPPRVKFGRLTRWRASTVDRWIAEKEKRARYEDGT